MPARVEQCARNILQRLQRVGVIVAEDAPANFKAFRMQRQRAEVLSGAHAAEDALDHAKRSANQRPPHLLPRRPCLASTRQRTARRLARAPRPRNALAT